MYNFSLRTADRNRAVRETDMNDVSSRSHSIFQVTAYSPHWRDIVHFYGLFLAILYLFYLSTTIAWGDVYDPTVISVLCNFSPRTASENYSSIDAIFFYDISILDCNPSRKTRRRWRRSYFKIKIQSGRFSRYMGYIISM